eukprot:9242315-Lingulodinium_polyedra.AAC.1
MPAWGGDWLLWVRNARTGRDWWHWCDACRCFADASHAVSTRHINKLHWYVPNELPNAEAACFIAGDDDVGAPWATS